MFDTPVKPKIKAVTPKHYHPLEGNIIIEIPPRFEKTRSGILVDTTFPTGSTYDYATECRMVAKRIIQSKEGQYMIKWKQRDKLERIVRSEVARVPKVRDEVTLGADRYNQIHAEVLASSVDEIQVGDIVYFGYLTIPDLREDKRVFFYQEEDAKMSDFTEYAALQANRCFFRVREGKITMLNDYVLIDPLPVDIHAMEIRTESNKFDKQFGKVAFAHKDSELCAGDKIIMDSGCDAELEFEVSRTLPQPYFCLKESEILAIVT